MLNTLGHSQFSETYEDYLKMPTQVLMSKINYLKKLAEERKKLEKAGQ